MSSTLAQIIPLDDSRLVELAIAVHQACIALENFQMPSQNGKAALARIENAERDAKKALREAAKSYLATIEKPCLPHLTRDSIVRENGQIAAMMLNNFVEAVVAQKGLTALDSYFPVGPYQTL